MFYLKQYLEHILKHPVLTFFYVTFLVCLFSAITFEKSLNRNFEKLVPDAQEGPHFFALISETENVARIRRKMVTLPGVKRVALLDQKKVMQQVKATIKNFKLDDSAISELKLKGLKIVFKPEATKRTMLLAREYLSKQAPEENLTVGRIKDFDKNNKNNLNKFIREWGVLSLSGLFFILWFSLAIFNFKKIKQRAYIISQFQRRRRVAFKMVLSGSSSIALLIAIVCAAVPSADLLNLGIVVSAVILLNAFFMGEQKWQK